MSTLKCGIVGLPNVGKSTLFNALSRARAEAENFPFCTIDPNVGVVPVPDERLHELAEILQPEEVIPTSIEFVDIAGLVKGASEGKGKGNAFLSHIRLVDLVVHVVRCFGDPNVVHVEGEVDPERDIRIIEDELILKDLESVEKRLSDLKKQAKSGDKQVIRHQEIMKRLKEHLESGDSARTFTDEPGEREAYDDLFLLSDKPVLYACNVSEDHLGETPGSDCVETVRKIANEQGGEVVSFCAKMEAEIAELEEGEKTMFLDELGVDSAGLDRLVRAAYRELGLITFFTTLSGKVEAWTVEKGSTAPQAAGEIHTDFEKGFIKAEVIPFETFLEHGSEKAVRDAGEMRREGKDYVVRDGDVILFRFNV